MAPRVPLEKDAGAMPKGAISVQQSHKKSAARKSNVALILTALAYLILAGFGSPISQLNLSPVYGSIPSSLYHAQLITFIAALSYIVKRSAKQRGEKERAWDYQNWIAPWMYWTPAIQYVLFQHSEVFGPLWGPVITEAATYYPILFLTFVSTSLLLDDLGLQKYGSRIADATPAVVSFGVLTGAEKVANMIIPQIIGTTDFFTRTGLQLLNATLAAALSRSSLLVFAIPAMIHTLFNNPHHYAVGSTKYVNNTLFEYQYALLERHDSLTGYISVVKNKKDGFLALRCDHSVLGGEWLVTAARKRTGQEVRETIYAVFTMLEAVRLIKTEVFAPDDEKDALFIGLGVGTAPKAFIAHGLNTTIVEIDPIVHHFATKYFELPSNHTKVIANAVTWAAQQAKERPETYDYIVHDVFTGGAEPTALFTYEFLQDLNTLLKEDGAIAINYAGDIAHATPRIILNTIFAVFPSCKAYRDTIPEAEAETFLNMVVYCIKTPTEIEFRLPTNDDYLNSMARRQFLPPDEGLEIKLGELGGTDRKWTQYDILARGNESLVEEHHGPSAMRHWRIMRTVLPAAVWENW